jgi:desulfoferrodoxin (superoxide reductase-like protein)
MQNRRDFLAQSGLFATAAALPAAFTGCSSEDDPPAVEPILEWEEVADSLEQNPRCCWTGDPSEVALGSPSVGAHLPEISLDTVNGRLRATVFTLGDEDNTGQLNPHPMNAAHWITVMYVRNQDNVVVAFRDFGRAEIFADNLDIDPRITFDVPAGTTSLRAYAFCNLHQHWRGRRVEIED